METLQYDTKNNSLISTSRLVDLKEILVEVAMNYEFFYILDKDLLLHMNEEVHVLSPGDLFIANPGDAFMILPKDESSFLLYLSLNPEVVKEKDDTSIQFTTITKKEELHYAPIHAMYKFYEEEMRGDKDKKFSIKGYFYEKMKPLCHEVNYHESKRDKKILMIQEAASKLFEPDGDSSLDTIAAELGISPSYLSRVFKEVSGMGFSDYSQRKKLELSSSLLQENLTIDKVAEQTGFSSTKSLNRIYNHLLQKTPSEYRRELLETPRSTESQEKLRKRPEFQKFASQFSELSYSKALKEYLGEDHIYHKLSLHQLESSRNSLWGMGFTLSNFGEDYIEEIPKFHGDGRINGISISLLIDENVPNLVYLQDLKRAARFNEIVSILDFLETLNIPVMLNVEVKDISIRDACNDLRREVLSRCIQTIEDFMVKLLQMISRPLAKKFLYVFNHSFVLELKDQRSINLFADYMERKHQVLERVLQSSDYLFAYHYGQKTKSELETILDFLSKNRHRLRLPNYSLYQFKMPQEIHITEAHMFSQAYREYTENLQALKELEDDQNLTNANMVHHGTVTTIDIGETNELYEEIIASMLCLDYFLNLDPPTTSMAKYSFIFNNHLGEEQFSFQTKMVDLANFRTPLYYISQNINMMKGDVIYYKNGCLVTKQGEEFSVLLFNHPILDIAFGLEKGFNHLDEYSADLTIEISGVKGRYKENRHLINYKHGSSAYHRKNFSDPELMTPREKEYVRRLSIPKLMADFHDFDGTLRRTISLSPFELMILHYTPI